MIIAKNVFEQFTLKPQGVVSSQPGNCDQSLVLLEIDVPGMCDQRLEIVTRAWSSWNLAYLEIVTRAWKL